MDAVPEGPETDTISQARNAQSQSQAAPYLRPTSPRPRNAVSISPSGYPVPSSRSSERRPSLVRARSHSSSRESSPSPQSDPASSPALDGVPGSRSINTPINQSHVSVQHSASDSPDVASSVQGMSGIDPRTASDISTASAPDAVESSFPASSSVENAASPLQHKAIPTTAPTTSRTFATFAGRIKEGLGERPRTLSVSSTHSASDDNPSLPSSRRQPLRGLSRGRALPLSGTRSLAEVAISKPSVGFTTISGQDSIGAGAAGVLFSMSSSPPANASPLTATARSGVRNSVSSSGSIPSVSGASGSGGSTGTGAGGWSFFRSSSSTNTNAGSSGSGIGMANPKSSLHSISYSSLKGLAASASNASFLGGQGPGAAMEPMLSPIIGTSGTTTPLGHPHPHQDGSSDSGRHTPLVGLHMANHSQTDAAVMSSGVGDDRYRTGMQAQIDAAFRRSRPSLSASYQVYESAPNGTQAGRSGFQAPSGLSVGRRKPRQYSHSAAESSSSTKAKKAEGLVAFAVRGESTSDDARVVVGGRNLLKILSIKTPHGRRRQASASVDDDEGNLDYSASTFYGSVRDRSPDARAGNDEEEYDGRSRRSTHVCIQEEVDLQAGLYHASNKTPRAALINDVSWGFGLTANKVLTGNSNGTVTLYDLEKSGSKLERLKTMHQSGRPINVCAFGGVPGQGTLMASGCQDGDVKVADIRHSHLITLSTPLDPVRSICFPPQENCTADPYYLFSVYESGNLARWDLRQPKMALDRTLAHQGGAISLDWRGTFPSDRGGISPELGSVAGDWGWVVTAGMDGTAKIWNMSSSPRTPRLVRTLHVNRPIGYVRWHGSPSRPSDVVVVPLSASSAVGGQLDSNWQPNVEIWDARREYVPKQTFWTDGVAISATSPFFNGDVLYALSKNSSTFEQIDIEKEAANPMDYLPRAATAWSAEGTLAATVGSLAYDADTQLLASASPKIDVDEQVTIRGQSTAIIEGAEVDFDPEVFRYLSEQYHFRSRPDQALSVSCQLNAQAAASAKKYDASKMWLLISEWLVSEEKEAVAKKASENLEASKLRKERPPSPPKLTGKQQFRSSSGTVAHHHLQRDLHSSRHSSPLVTSQVLSEADISPGPFAAMDLPAAENLQPPPIKASNLFSAVEYVADDTSDTSTDPETETGAPETDRPLPTGSKEDDTRADTAISAMSRSAASLLTKVRPALPAISRQTSPDHSAAGRSHGRSALTSPAHAVPNAFSQRSDLDFPSPSTASKIAASGTAVHKPSALAAQVNAVDMSRGSSGTVRGGAGDAASDSEPDVTISRQDPASLEEPEGNDDDEDHENTADALRQRAQRRHAAILNRRDHQIPRYAGDRRGRANSSGLEQIRSRSTSAQRKTFATSASRNSSRSASSRGRRSRKVSQSRHDNRMADQADAQNRAAKDLMTQRMEEHLTRMVQDLADEGDIQTSTVLALLLRERLGLPGYQVARLSTAYLGLLRLLDCHANAAGISKASTVDSIRKTTLDHTTLHTACGRCEKAIVSPPFNKCLRCTAVTTVCNLCHKVELHALIFCATCGHGAHEKCLYEYASELSSSPFDDVVHEDECVPWKPSRIITTPSTVPSSPLVPSGSSTVHWLFPHEHALFSSAGPSRIGSRAASPDPHDEKSRQILLSQCPAGCGHQCLLDLPFAETA